MPYRYRSPLRASSRVCFLITLALASLMAAVADAYPWRPDKLPATPALAEPGMLGNVCNTCHTNGGGTARNPFGLDWEAAYPMAEDAGLTPAQAFAAVADLDSDGDSFTNEQELAVRKHPGNAASKPNTPPTAHDATVTTTEDAAVNVTLLVTDPDDDVLTFATVDGPDHGTLSGSAPDLTYTPAREFSGQDAFTFSVTDGHAASQPATVAISVTPVDDRPMLNAAFVLEDLRVDQGAPDQALDLLGLFTDVDSQVVLSASSSDPSIVDVAVEATILRLAYGRRGSATVQVIARGAAGVASFTVLVETPWDVNGDGRVDIRDLVTVAAAFGDNMPANASADANGDGIVNVIDLVIVASHFGESVQVAPSLDLTLRRQVAEWLYQARMADDGSEVFRRGIAVLEALAVGKPTTSTRLLPNYPNPFNPETWIPFELERDGQVTIAVYDASGREVRRLELGLVTAGVYHAPSRAAHWDGRNDAGEPVASGTYFVVLSMGADRDVRELLLRK